MQITDYIKKYAIYYIVGLGAIVAVDIVQLQIPEITARVTDTLEANQMTMGILKKTLIELILFGVGITVLRFIWRQCIFGTSRKIEYELRNRFFSHLESLDPDFYSHQKTGDLMAYATNDLNAIRMMYGPGILMVLDTFVLTTIVIIQMVRTTDIRLTLFAILPMPLIAIGSIYLGRMISHRFDRKQAAFARLSDIVQENISGIRVIKAFVQSQQEIIAFNGVNKDNFDKNMEVVKLQALTGPLTMLVTGLSITIALGYGGRLTMLGAITLGDFVAFIQYLLMLVWPMMAFGMFINIYSQGMASKKRFADILSVEPTITDEQMEVHEQPIIGHIRMDGLTFAYDSTREPVLKDIDLSIQAGDYVGIVGKTGAGKTTLVNLLLRLYDCDEDALWIDGRPIRSYPKSVLREQIGYVPQDNFLFSDTISNNIAFGVDEASQEDIEHMAKQVDVHENIIEFEKGYETLIGERGVTLSGGQKQRVSIARALIKQPAILILDDAVSAVDTKTEERILTHLKEERKGKTTIAIAHRVSTIMHADTILVLDKGRVVEMGNHDTLMERQGTYYQMVMKQQLEESIDDIE